jgi:hypothetical protein
VGRWNKRALPAGSGLEMRSQQEDLTAMLVDQKLFLGVMYAHGRCAELSSLDLLYTDVAVI